MQEQVGEGNMFSINSLDFNTTDVFLMVKVIDPSQKSRVEFTFQYEQDLGMQAGTVVAIILSNLLAVFFIVILVINILNQKGITKIPLPRKLRLLRLRNLVTKQENVDDSIQELDISENVKNSK